MKKNNVTRKPRKIKKVEFIDKVGSSELESPVLQTKLSKSNEVKRVKLLKKKSDLSLEAANHQMEIYKSRISHLTEENDELKKQIKDYSNSNIKLSGRLFQANAYIRKNMIILFSKRQF